MGEIMSIGKPLKLSPAFPPTHTVRATFTAYGVPSCSSKFTSSFDRFKFSGSS